MNKNAVITEAEAATIASLQDAKKVTEISPLVFDKNLSGDDLMYDFRPQVVEADRLEANPLDLSAVEPASLLTSETIGLEDFSQEQEMIVPVAKDNGKHKA